MFINIKINLKTIIILIIIIAIIISLISIKSHITFSSNDPNLIELNTQNYTNILKEVHMYTDRYINHPIKGNGYIYIDDTLDKKQFVLARNMIVCCENDPIVVGILCEYPHIDKFEKNSWVEIEGTVNMIERDGMNIPMVKVIKMQNCKMPSISTVTPPTI